MFSLANPGPGEALDKGWEDQPVWDRPGDVANEDAGIPFPLGQFLKGRAGHGVVKSAVNGVGRVWKQRHGMLPDQVSTNGLGQINRQPPSSVEEINLHFRCSLALPPIAGLWPQPKHLS